MFPAAINSLSQVWIGVFLQNVKFGFSIFINYMACRILISTIEEGSMCLSFLRQERFHHFSFFPPLVRFSIISFYLVLVKFPTISSYLVLVSFLPHPLIWYWFLCVSLFHHWGSFLSSPLSSVYLFHFTFSVFLVKKKNSIPWRIFKFFSWILKTYCQPKYISS